MENNKERKKRTYRIHCLDDHRTSLEAGCYSKLKFDLRRPPPRRSKILGERFPFPLKDDDPRLPVSKQQNKTKQKFKQTKKGMHLPILHPSQLETLRIYASVP